ncbi:MAG: right-handed parallel beta-helix repeat-containing protein [Candidatus Binatia bacterium]|nr:right-handed parallel beta-helix repeat-containing protein [Candidatus Binatia bacterium]
MRIGGNDNADGRTPATALRTIAAAASRISNPGDVVVIGPGTYEEGNIAPARNGIQGRPVSFRGDPTGVETGDPAGPVRIVVRPPATTAFLLLGNRFVRISDLQIEGGSDAGIQARPRPGGSASAALVLERVLVRGSAKRGIDLRGVQGSVQIESSEVSDNGSGGLSVEGDGATTTVTILNSQIQRNNGPGVFLRLLSAATITGSTLQNNTGAGMVVRGASAIVVQGNQFISNAEESVSAGSLEPVTDLVLENNRSSAAGKTAFVLVASGEARLRGNVVTAEGSHPGAGISVEAAGHEPLVLSIEANQVDGVSDDCVLARSAGVVRLAENALKNCGGNGIRLESVSAATVVANSATQLAGSGILINGGDRINLVANSVTQARGGGIVVNAGATQLQAIRLDRGEISAADGVGVSIRGAAAVRVVGTTVRDGSGHGVLLREVSRVELDRLQVGRMGGTGLIVGGDTDFSNRSVRVSGGRWYHLGGGALKVWTQGSVSVTGTEVLDSGGPGISVAGLPATRVEIVDASIGMHQADGVFIRGVRSGALVNNRVFSNRQSGIVLRSTDQVFVANNLVYANRGEGLAVGVGGEPSARTVVVFNTLYGNGLRGIRIDGPGDSSLVEGGLVLNNIIAGNREAGIAVARTAMPGYVSGFNVNTDGYAPDTRRNPFDIVASPGFLDPAGPDGVLGEDGFRDDNFRLAHRRTGQPANSAAVDAGSDDVGVLGVSGSTAADGLPDTGRADAGFHYGLDASSLSQKVNPPFMPLFVRSAAGSDGNDGRSPSTALASIRNAFERAVAGVTVVVGPGYYREGDIRIRNSSGRVTFLGDPSGYLTGDLPGPVLVDATGFDTGFVIQDGGPVLVRGFYVTGALQAGIQVRAGADSAEIRDNIVFSNLRRGIDVNGANNVSVRNNLVYANGTGGVQIQASRGSLVEGNTIYGNGADGILVGTSVEGGAATETMLLRNIVVGNGEAVAAANGVQIKVSANSREGFRSSYNVVWGRTPFAADTPRSDSDLVVDPLLRNPAGPDGILGAAGFADDDFTLSQGDDSIEVSPAVDLDVEVPDSHHWGSTTELGTPDLGAVDAGYHYPLFHPLVELGRPVFVRGTGDDRNDGSSRLKATRTVERALELTGGGGFVIVGPGRYPVSGLALGRRAGKEKGPTPILWGDETGLLTGDAPGPVILDFGGGRGVTVRGSAVLHGLRLVNARNAAVRVLAGARDVWVQHNVFCGNDGDGVWSAATGVDLVNNLFAGNGGWGVRLTPRRGTGYVRVMNATVAQNVAGGVWVTDRTRPRTQVRLANNVIAGNGGTGAMLYVGSGRTVPWGYNLNADGYSKAPVQGPGAVAAPPQFSRELSQPPPACPEPTAFRLLPSSPARDAGTGDLRLLGLTGRSATVDDAPDLGRPDLGYHRLVVR